MRLSGLFWWISACVAAILAGILSYSTLNQRNPIHSEAKLDTVAVVVAVADIPRRRSIRRSEVAIRELPVGTVPKGAAISLDQVLGKMATVELFANQPILAQQLTTPDAVTKEIALTIPPGKVVTVVPTQSKLISSQLLRAGDRIDLLATFDLELMQDAGTRVIEESIALLQNLEIHAIILPVIPTDGETTVGSEDRGGVIRTFDERGQSILLAVEPADALAIRHILNVGGIIDLTLRAPDDDTLMGPVVVDQFYLAERYQIQLTR